MQGDFLAVDSAPVERSQDVVGEVQSGRRSGHASLHFGVDRLVSHLVALLRFAIQIRRNGQLSHCFEYLGKAHLGVVPTEIDPIVGARPAPERLVLSHIAPGAERQPTAFDFELALESALFPLLQIANHTQPRALPAGLEHLFIIRRGSRLHQKNLYQGPGFLAEVHPRLDDARVVEDHQGPLRQVTRQLEEQVVGEFAPIIDQQLAAVALRHGIFRNAVVGQRIVKITDMNMSCFHDYKKNRTAMLKDGRANRKPKARTGTPSR